MGSIGNAPPVPTAASGGQPPFARDIDESWFDAEPSAERSPAVARAWRRFWQWNALNALHSAAEGLGREIPHLVRAVEAFDVDRRLAPRMSARLATLMEAMWKGDGYGVYDTVQSWCADPPETWYAEGCVTESIALHGWESHLLHEVRSTRVEGVPPLHCFPLLETDVAPLHAAAMRAMDLIAGVDPDMHAEIVSHVSMVKLFTGRGIEGLSSPKAFGAIWLRTPEDGEEIPWFLEHLVHECSHLHLNALLALDPLLTNPNDIHKAPIRPDPRPLFQVLHGTFVLARNRRVHRRLVARHPDLGLEPALARFDEQFASGMAVLTESMQTTPRGGRLLESLRA
ncbi:MAG: hypothetical protein EBX36_02200 [Planctomycetia bacterium]|nr:hypothetical protein [Planctomycetia bacterium]